MDDPFEQASRYQKFFLSHIICPDHIVNQTQVSWLVGWNLDHFKCLIIDYIPQSLAKLEDLDQTLARVHEKHGFFHYNYFLKPRNAPIVLGKWIPDASAGYLPSSTHQGRGIWVTLCKRQGRPGLFSIHSLGNLYNTSVYMLGYPLVRTEHLQSIALSQPIETIPSATSEQEALVGLINTHQDVHAILAHALSESASDETNTRWATNLLSGLLTVSWMWYTILAIVKRFSTTTRPLLSYAMDRITWRELQLSSHRSGSGGGADGGSGSGGGGSSSSGGGDGGGGGVGGIGGNFCIHTMQKVSLEAVSIAWYQLYQKVQQFQFAIQSGILLTLSWEIDSRHRSKYWMRVWSTLCYLAVDLLLGLALAVVLLRHSQAISSWLGAFFHSSFLDLENVLDSFRHSPGGVKLNPYITRKIGKGLIFFLRHWRDLCIESVSSYYPRLLWLLAILSPFGLSVQVGLALDFARVLVLPMTLFQSLFSVEFAFHCQLVYSLYLFFKSSKKNVLRQRYDSCEYDADQLPFGTMLFSIMLFLLPSFAIYYYYFSFIQVCLLMSIYCVFILVETLKFFPYQALAGNMCCADRVARIDSVEIACQHVSTRTADGGEVADNAGSHESEVRPLSPWNPEKAKPRKSLKVKGHDASGAVQTGEDLVKRQLLEGLIEGLSPKATQRAAKRMFTDDPTQNVLCFDAMALDGRAGSPFPSTGDSSRFEVTGWQAWNRELAESGGYGQGCGPSRSSGGGRGGGKDGADEDEGLEEENNGGGAGVEGEVEEEDDDGEAEEEVEEEDEDELDEDGHEDAEQAERVGGHEIVEDARGTGDNPAEYVPILSLPRVKAAGFVEKTSLMGIFGSDPAAEEDLSLSSAAQRDVSTFVGNVVHHRTRKGTEDSVGRMMQEKADDQSSSPSASIAASIASQSVTDASDRAAIYTGASHAPWLGFEGRWGSQSSFLSSTPTGPPLSVAMYMSYRPSRPRWSQQLAGLVSWLRFLIVEKAVVWQILRRVCVLRQLRCKISKVAQRYHQQVFSQQEQEALEIINYLFPRNAFTDRSGGHGHHASRSHLAHFHSREEELEEYKLLVTHALPFHRSVQFIMMGSLPSQAMSGGNAFSSPPFPQREKLRYGAQVVWGIALLMAISLASLVVALMGWVAIGLQSHAALSVPMVSQLAPSEVITAPSSVTTAMEALSTVWPSSQLVS